MLAVLQKHHEIQKANVFELLLIRLPEGEIWKSFSIPYDGFHERHRVARRFFSPDGRLVAWHEFAPSDERHVVRIWDVEEEREKCAIEGAVYPVLSPDGKILAAVDQSIPRPLRKDSFSCRLYDVRDGRVLHTLQLPGDRAGWQPWPEFSPDGRLLVVNCGSSSGRGESILVFDVASAKTVFESQEWSSHFVAGPTLVTVKDNSALFRATDTWQVRARVMFSLGRHWENGGELSPEPEPVPGRAAVIVYDYYPIANDRLGTLGRYLHLTFEPGHRATWIDATSGAMTPFMACDGLLWRTTVSPSGSRLAVHGSGMTIWELPPRRSWIPTALVIGLLALIWGAWTVVRRRLTVRARAV
jgi:hypothetical protein